jgi:hypothetical protein
MICSVHVQLCVHLHEHASQVEFMFMHKSHLDFQYYSFEF